MAKKRASKAGKKKAKKLGPKSKGLVSVAHFAKQMGVTKAAVNKAIKLGRIEIRTIGRIRYVDPKVAKEDWETNRKKDVSPQHEESDNFDDEESDPETFDDNREITPKTAALHRRLSSAKREKWLARKAELEFKEAAGQLVSADKVEHQAFELARRTRDHILNIPDRISADLVGITDQAAMHSKLTFELTAALTELADGKKKKPTRAKK